MGYFVALNAERKQLAAGTSPITLTIENVSFRENVTVQGYEVPKPPSGENPAFELTLQPGDRRTVSGKSVFVEAGGNDRQVAVWVHEVN